MAGLNDDGQWIVLMGFLISIALLFLMVIMNQATLVGQTTAEGVLEFPKHEIRDLRAEVFRAEVFRAGGEMNAGLIKDIEVISLKRNHAIVSISFSDYPVSGSEIYPMVTIRFNNGVCEYEEAFIV